VSAQQRETLDAILRQNSFPADSDINEQRRLLKELVAGQPLPADLTMTAATLGGVPVAEITIAGIEPRQVVLYFHGGVYVLGDAFQAADLARPGRTAPVGAPRQRGTRHRIARTRQARPAPAAAVVRWPVKARSRSG
jgi:acetyl esterase/lipase